MVIGRFALSLTDLGEETQDVVVDEMVCGCEDAFDDSVNEGA